MKTGLAETVASDLFSAGSHFSIILGRSPDLQAESIFRFQVSPPSPDKAEWHIGETSPANSGGTAPDLHRLPYYVLADTLDICVPRIPLGYRENDVNGLVLQLSSVTDGNWMFAGTTFMHRTKGGTSPEVCTAQDRSLTLNRARCVRRLTTESTLFFGIHGNHTSPALTERTSLRAFPFTSLSVKGNCFADRLSH
jgi:hypothetical protein